MYDAHAGGSCNAPIERVTVTDRALLAREAAKRVGTDRDSSGTALTLEAILHRDEYR
jgi:hypothetical protein